MTKQSLLDLLEEVLPYVARQAEIADAGFEKGPARDLLVRIKAVLSQEEIQHRLSGRLRRGTTARPTGPVLTLATASGLARAGQVDEFEFAQNDDEGAWHIQNKATGMFAVYSPDPSFGTRSVPALAEISDSRAALAAILDHIYGK